MKIAVIGTGSWGKNLVRNYIELKALHTVCDIDPHNLMAMKKLYPSIVATRSYEKVLRNKDIDAVAIATPASLHYDVARAAILAGKDVFVEKPMALRLEEGVKLMRLARQHKRILMVGHLLEYHPGILKLKELIDKGRLGAIYYIYSQRANLGKIMHEENILWSFAPHDISVILLLTGESPVSVSAKGGYYLRKHIADVTVSNLEFASGIKGHIFVSWLHPFKDHRLVVVGSKSMALFDDVAPSEKLKLYSHKVKLEGVVPIAVNAPAEVVDFDRTEPLKRECAHFLECVRTRKRPKTDGMNGVRVLRVLHACQLSLEQNGKEIQVEEGS